MCFVAVLGAGCATRNIVPGVAVGATAAQNGDLAATISVSPEVFFCTIMDLVRLRDVCAPGTAELEPAPAAGVPTSRLWTPGSPEHLRASVLAGPMRSLPALNGPIPPSKHYPGYI